MIRKEPLRFLTPPLNRAQVKNKCLTPISMALFMSDQPNLEYVKIKMIPWEVFSHQKLISVTNGWNSKKKICEAYNYKKIFEMTTVCSVGNGNNIAT